jgi:hypothetical protein
MFKELYCILEPIICIKIGIENLYLGLSFPQRVVLFVLESCVGCTLCSKKIERSDIFKVPNRKSRDMQL